MRDPNATPAANWIGGRNSGQIIILPSGNRARCRRTFSLMEAMKSGTLPNPLAKLIQDMLDVGTPPKMPETPEQARVVEQEAMERFLGLDTDTQLSLFELIDAECYKIFISPRLVPVPAGEDPAKWSPDGEDELSIHDLSWEDRIFAYNWAQGAPMDLSRFHKTTEDMAALADERALQQQAQPAT